MDRAHHSQLKELLLHLAELKKRLDAIHWEVGEEIPIEKSIRIGKASKRRACRADRAAAGRHVHPEVRESGNPVRVGAASETTAGETAGRLHPGEAGAAYEAVRSGPGAGKRHQRACAQNSRTGWSR